MPDIQSNLYYTDFLCCDTDTHKPTDFIQTFSIIQILHRYLIFYITVLPVYTKKRTQKPKVTVAVAGKSELGTEHFAEHINLAFLRVKSWQRESSQAIGVFIGPVGTNLPVSPPVTNSWLSRSIVMQVILVKRPFVLFGAISNVEELLKMSQTLKVLFL